MNEIEVTKQHMDALKALSDVNLKVSEARNLLTKLQEEETEYLVSREKKAVERLQNTLILSHNLVEETNKNYETITQFSKDVASGAEILARAVDGFKTLNEAKEKFFADWERDIKNQEETIVSLRNNLKVDAVNIDGQRKQLDARNVDLNTLQTKIEVDRGEIDRKIMRFNQGRT